MTGSQHIRSGAYGLNISVTQRDIAAENFVTAPDDWIKWSFDVELRQPSDEPVDDDCLTDIHATFSLEPAGEVDIDRPTQRTVLRLPHIPSDDEILHPYLATTAAAVAWWQGRFAVHGSCAGRDGRAFAFLGNRGQGKSSTLAWLHQNGWSCVSDDLLITDVQSVYAGPRFYDLREPTASAWGIGEYLGVVGTRERWRVRTSPVDPVVPLAAFVELAWGDEISVRRVPPAERLARLYAYRTLDVQPRDGVAMLRLMSVPFLELTRPKNLNNIEDCVDAVLHGM